MTTLDDLRQRRAYPRKFISEPAELGNWDQLSAYFDKLEHRTITSPADLEQWILDLSELEAAIGEEGTIRHIKMTCFTEDETLERSFLDYIENILPKTRPRYFELNRKYLHELDRWPLSGQRYFVYTRDARNEVEIFRPENVPLQTRDEILGQEYQKLCGSIMVDFEGREQTLPQMARYLEETDRRLRRGAWEATTTRQLKDRESREQLLDKMIAVRHQIARNAGFKNFIEYQFRALGRFDYTPDDCHAFHRAVEEHIVPLKRELGERRREQLKVQKLSPWDLDVDPLGRPPLRPFETADQLVAGADKIFTAVNPVFSREFEVLRANNLLDLDSRKGKAPGGYQSTLEEMRLPFIFMNAAGLNTDVFTLLHEGGHAFHALATRGEEIHEYRSAPIEFCEVASMGMEMMSCERLESFYDPESARRARQMHLEDVINVLPWIARIDAYQHFLYTNPDHTRQERESEWLKLDERFGDPLDWSVLPEWRAASWVRQLHIFEVPLYYIEYGIAQLGALQLWNAFLADPEGAVEKYRAALALGGSRPLPDLFSAAGLRFSFDAETIRPLATQVREALAELN